jgi:L-asparaginase II
VTTSIFLCALLASGLALALARENRLRRAFQDLVARLLAKLRQQADFPTHTKRRRPS